MFWLLAAGSIESVMPPLPVEAIVLTMPATEPELLTCTWMLYVPPTVTEAWAHEAVLAVNVHEPPSESETAVIAKAGAGARVLVTLWE